MKLRPPHHHLAVMQRRGLVALYCNRPADDCDWHTGYVPLARWATACRAGLTHIKEHR